MKKIYFLTLLILVTLSSKGQWIQTSGPYGGNISDILINGNTVYSATMGGGIFVSTNNGNNWDTLNTGLTNYFAYSLKLSNNKVFAGTHGGLFYTNTNGINWSALYTGNPVSSIDLSDSVFFAGTLSQGVIFSADSGLTWNNAANWGLPAIPMTSNYFPISTVAAINSNWFAAKGNPYGGVYLSTNKGNTWSQVNSGLTNVQVNTLAVIDSVIFAGTSGGGVFYSSNKGNSWTTANNGLMNLNILTLKVNNNKLFAGTDSGGVFVSADYGLNWTPINNGLSNTLEVKSIAVNDSNLFAGTSSIGIFNSIDYGANWVSTITGLINHFAGSLITTNGKLLAGLSSGNYNTNGDGLLGAGDVGEGISISADSGNSWTTMNSLLTNYKVNCFAVIDSNLFAGTDGDGVFVSTDLGFTWNMVNSGLTNLEVTSLAVIGNNLFAGVYGGVFLSTNLGANWTSVSSGLNPFYSIRSLAAKGSDLYSGTNGQGIFKSVNNGVSWTLLNSYSSYAAAISMAISGSNILAGSVFHGILLSTDDGANWSPVYGGYIYSFAVNGNNVFAGTSNGVAVSSDNGLSWSHVNNMGLTNLNILSLTTDSINLYAGTAGCGTFLMPIVEAIPTGIETIEQSNRNLKIFPNPFSIQTTLRTDKFLENASLTVYNSVGQTVKRIDNLSGQTIIFHRDNLPSGLYFVRLTQDGSTISTDKFVITDK